MSRYNPHGASITGQLGKNYFSSGKIKCAETLDRQGFYDI
jgi:hypothetical protein